MGRQSTQVGDAGGNGVAGNREGIQRQRGASTQHTIHVGRPLQAGTEIAIFRIRDTRAEGDRHTQRKLPAISRCGDDDQRWRVVLRRRDVNGDRGRVAEAAAVGHGGGDGMRARRECVGV